MNPRGHGSLWKGALLCLALLGGGGCNGDLGALCAGDDDCRGGLRCLRASEASRGTCAYPAAMSDLGPRVDGSSPDLDDHDAAADGPYVDAPSADASPDSTPPDGQNPDSLGADAHGADVAAADAAGDLLGDGAVDGGSARDLPSDAMSAD